MLSRNNRNLVKLGLATLSVGLGGFLVSISGTEISSFVNYLSAGSALAVAMTYLFYDGTYKYTGRTPVKPGESNKVDLDKRHIQLMDSIEYSYEEYLRTGSVISSEDKQEEVIEDYTDKVLFNAENLLSNIQRIKGKTAPELQDELDRLESEVSYMIEVVGTNKDKLTYSLEDSKKMHDIRKITNVAVYIATVNPSNKNLTKGIEDLVLAAALVCNKLGREKVDTMVKKGLSKINTKVQVSELELV